MAKKLTNKLLFVVRIFIILMSAIILCCVVVVQTRDKTICKEKYYFVYATKTKSISVAENTSKEIEARGGAGNIYTIDDAHFVILSAYCLREEGKSVCDSLKTEFAGCGVIELDCTISVKLKISKNKMVQKYCKTLAELCDYMCKNAINYDLNKISISEILKQIIKYRQNFLYIIQSENIEDIQTILSSGNLIVEYIDMFCHSIFSSSSYSSVIKKLTVWCVTELYQIKNLL